MVNENLLATYSLLSFIRESFGDDSKESLLAVFVPLVKAALVRKLKENNYFDYHYAYSETNNRYSQCVYE